jgi:hypothetical protein
MPLKEDLGKKVLPPIGDRIVVAEAVADGLTVCEYAPNSASHAEFEALAKAAASGYADCHGSVRRAVLQVS